MPRPETSHHTLPPFPDDIDVAPLLSISLRKLEANDERESKRFFQACKDLGFFYLDMFDSDLGERIIRGAEGVNAVQQRWLKLSNAEKDKYGRPVLHDFFAYRFGEVPGQFDANGDPLRIENYNASIWPAGPLTTDPQRRCPWPDGAPQLPPDDP